MRTAPQRPSLLKPIAWLGADRRAVIIMATCNVLLGYAMFTGFGLFYGATIAVPAVLFSLGLWAFRGMYDADPRMLGVGLRHMRYERHYGPSGHLTASHPKIEDFKT